MCRLRLEGVSTVEMKEWIILRTDDTYLKSNSVSHPRKKDSLFICHLVS